jgi:prepilin-type N-terminal cleavage/methylation domain-containing protein/prepilin-type processing-associated H-X9-DG protein
LGAFTLLELLVVIAILGLLVGILLPVLSRVRSHAQNTTCLMHLHDIAGALRVYATEHHGRMPDPDTSLQPWEQILRRLLPDPMIFRCPADDELYPAVGSSYDWRDTGNPQTTLAGRVLGQLRSDLVLVFESLPGWHRGGRMNAGFLDGSARTMHESECLKDLQAPVQIKPSGG